MHNGISLIICCYNSKEVIKETLESILNNSINQSISFEIIIVDNASTDGTGEYIKEIWENFQMPYELKLLYEHKPGLIHARKTAVLSASYDILIFCDDDNRLDSTYIQKAFDVMIANPKIGACGGCGEADLGQEVRPDWFHGIISEGFAIGKQANSNFSQISTNRLYLYGAGLVIRKCILDRIFHKNIQLLLTGRNGNKVLAGDDSEISFYTLFMGYELWYFEELKFKHLIVSKRLNVNYLFKMYEGFGRSLPYLHMYYCYLTKLPILKRYVSKSYMTLVFYLGYLFVKCKIISFKKNEYTYIAHMFKYGCIELLESYENYTRTIKIIKKNIESLEEQLEYR